MQLQGRQVSVDNLGPGLASVLPCHTLVSVIAPLLCVQHSSAAGGWHGPGETSAYGIGRHQGLGPEAMGSRCGARQESGEQGGWWIGTGDMLQRNNGGCKPQVTAEVLWTRAPGMQGVTAGVTYRHHTGPGGLA